MLAKHALSQLSYTPTVETIHNFRAFATIRKLGFTPFFLPRVGVPRKLCPSVIFLACSQGMLGYNPNSTDELRLNSTVKSMSKLHRFLTASRILFRAIILLGCITSAPVIVTAQDAPLKVVVDWQKVVRLSKTTTTLQVVVNPPLRQGSAIHDRAWRSLKDLRADYVRFVPWFPYPRLGVAELEPPTADHTSWDFTLIDPLVSDFFDATKSHPVMLNFSTIPQWMFRTDAPVAAPTDPNHVAWNYEQGIELRDPTAKEVADYYARIAGWYVNGGFTDELGKFRASPFHRKIDLWEVLNEPEYEHAMSPQTYTTIYDAVVESVRKVSPETKFVGMSLAEPSNRPDFFEYFLDHKNHKPGVPLDFISYHFYAVPTADQTPAIQQFSFFDQADKFLTSVRFVEAIRKRLSPDTRTAINEVGCILPPDINQGKAITEIADIPESYWNLCGAMFGYLYVSLVREGIDILASSQLVGYPTQFPSVTMLNWNNGEPNARYWVLKLLRDNFAPGDQLVTTTLSSPYVVAQAFVAANGTHKLLLVNKRDREFTLQIPGAAGGREIHVDLKSGAIAPVDSPLTSDTVVSGGYSVSILTLQK
jgi:hypothetical protein